MIFGTIMPASSIEQSNNSGINLEPCSVFRLPVEGSLITFNLLIALANLDEAEKPVKLHLEIKNEEKRLINSATGIFDDDLTSDNTITSITLKNVKIPNFGIYTIALFLGDSETAITECKIEFKKDTDTNE